MDLIADLLAAQEDQRHELVEVNVAYDVARLMDCHLLSEISRPEALKIMKMLNICSQSQKARANVAFAVGRMVKERCLADCQGADISTLIDLLAVCLAGEGAEINVAAAIERLAEGDFLNRDEKLQIRLKLLLRKTCYVIFLKERF